MSILKYLRRRPNTAAVAKERLQIIISHERNKKHHQPDYLAKLQQELVNVISKYVNINPENVNVALDNSGDCSILELNVTLPEVEMVD